MIFELIPLSPTLLVVSVVALVITFPRSRGHSKNGMLKPAHANRCREAPKIRHPRLLPHR